MKIAPLAVEYVTGLTAVLKMLPLEPFERVVHRIWDTYQKEGQIFIMGNGGSASTASHFASDINKGVRCGLEKRFKVICLNDSIPTMLAYANDQSYSDIFVEQLANLLRTGDLVIGISASGNSENVLKAIDYGDRNGASSAALTGFDGGELAKIAQLSIVIPSNDMQKVEDLHLVLTHMTMQILHKKLLSDERTGALVQDPDLVPKTTGL